MPLQRGLHEEVGRAGYVGKLCCPVSTTENGRPQPPTDLGAIQATSSG